MFAEHEAEVVPLLVPHDVLETIRLRQDWAAKADAVLDGPEPPEEPSASVTAVSTLDGRGYVRGSFDQSNFDVITKAIDLATAPPVAGEAVGSLAERQGQALVDVCRHFLDHHDATPGTRNRPHLNIVIPLRDLIDGKPGRTLDGSPVDAVTIRRLACDANVHRVITDGQSSVLDYGRATRTIPPAVYTSLTLRDRTCRSRAATANPSGAKDITSTTGNTAERPTSRTWSCCVQSTIHLPGWHLKLLPTGTVEVTDPSGHVRTSDPPQLC